MNRSKKTKQVYLELRNVLGDAFPAHRLLQSAARAVEITEEKAPITADQMAGFWEPIIGKGVDEEIKKNCAAFYPQEDWWIHYANKEQIKGLNYSFQPSDLYEFKEAA